MNNKRNKATAGTLLWLLHYRGRICVVYKPLVRNTPTLEQNPTTCPFTMVPIHPFFSSKWEELQERFRTQFSKIGNMRKQLFHVWRSFHFDENSEMTDAYVQRIRQVADILNFGKPQIFEIFKNILRSHLYWVLFPIDNLWQAVDTTKMNTKEKLHKQLVTQSIGTSTFLQWSKEPKQKTAMFNEISILGVKIDKLISIKGKLSTQHRQYQAI